MVIHKIERIIGCVAAGLIMGFVILCWFADQGISTLLVEGVRGMPGVYRVSEDVVFLRNMGIALSLFWVTLRLDRMYKEHHGTWVRDWEWH